MDFTRSTVLLALFLALHCIIRKVISTADEEARAMQAGRERWSLMGRRRRSIYYMLLIDRIIMVKT
jgi:hypothetical protein